MMREWVDELITGITEAFKARQASRNADKAQRAQVIQSKLDAASLQKQSTLTNPTLSVGRQFTGAPQTNIAAYLPIALIAGIGVVAIIALRK
jgi:hypothetical protein